MRDTWRDFRSPGAVLFALLLFFQFGNEWSLAGWLPLFLVRRLGISPAAGLMLVALYWLALLGGRIAAFYLMGRIRGRKLLLGSTLAAIFGLACFILHQQCIRGRHRCGVRGRSASPASSPWWRRRSAGAFPTYHPAYFNGIFSFAMMGAMLAPATLGFLAEAAGIGVVMALPLAGMCIVLALLVAALAGGQGDGAMRMGAGSRGRGPGFAPCWRPFMR